MDIVWICMSTLFVIKTSLAASVPPVLFVWTNESCIGGERGLLSTSLWLTFNASDQTGVNRCNNSLWIEYNSSLPLETPCEQSNGTSDEISNVTFAFEQPEHGGGRCHCVKIYFNNITTSPFQ